MYNYLKKMCYSVSPAASSRLKRFFMEVRMDCHKKLHNKVSQSCVRINLRFCMKVYPLGIIYIYYHAKSRCYSFKIGRVMTTSKLLYTLVHSGAHWYTLLHSSTLLYTLVQSGIPKYTLVNFGTPQYSLFTLVHRSTIWYLQLKNC